MPAARAAPIAARVRGRSSASFQISVRSRSQANARTSRGKSSREDQPLPATDETYAATSAICFVRELAAERGHHALAVRHAVDDERGRRLRLVEVRPDRAGGARVLQRVAALAAGGREHLLAGGGVALRLRRLRDLADDGLRRRCRGRSRPAAGEHGAADEQRSGPGGARARVYSTARRNAQHGPPARRAPSGGSVRTSARLGPAAGSPAGSSRRAFRVAQPADGRQ